MYKSNPPRRMTQISTHEAVKVGVGFLGVDEVAVIFVLGGASVLARSAGRLRLTTTTGSRDKDDSEGEEGNE